MMGDINRDTAEKVMGYEVMGDCPLGGVWVIEKKNQTWWNWHPEKSISQTFQVVNKMESLGFDSAIFCFEGTYTALFSLPEDNADCIDNLLDDERVVEGDNRLEVINLAALKTWEVKEKG